MIIFQRFYAVTQPENSNKFSQKKVNIGIFFSLIFGLFWPLAPIFGWSHYELEQTTTTCSVATVNSDIPILSYNICMFIFVYFMPLFLIIYTNIFLTKTVITLTNHKN